MTYPCITTTGGTDCAVLRVSDLLCYNISSGEWVKSEHGDIGFYSVSDKDKNITADYLRNTYGKVESKEHAEFIVKLAESAGFKLSSDGVDMSSVNSFMIYGDDKVIGIYTMKVEHLSNDEDYKLITLPLPPKESEEWPALGDEVSFPSGKGVLVVDKPDINGVVIVKSTDSESIDEYKKVSLNALKKPPTPEEELESKIRGMIEFTNYNHKAIAEYIINGEIKGLSYKPD